MRGDIIFKYQALSAPDFIVTLERVKDATTGPGNVKLNFRLYLGDRFHFLATHTTRDIDELIEEITPQLVEALLTAAVNEWKKFISFAEKTKDSFLITNSLKKSR